MADSPAFEYVCNELEARSDLDRLAARGTVRLALKEAGLDARSVTPEQLGVVLDKILPAELTARGVEAAASLGEDLRAGLARLEIEAPAETPETVFARLGGSA
jgi:predicted nucleotidyltransferase